MSSDSELIEIYSAAVREFLEDGFGPSPDRLRSLLLDVSPRSERRTPQIGAIVAYLSAGIEQTTPQSWRDLKDTLCRTGVCDEEAAETGLEVWRRALDVQISIPPEEPKGEVQSRSRTIAVATVAVLALALAVGLLLQTIDSRSPEAASLTVDDSTSATGLEGQSVSERCASLSESTVESWPITTSFTIDPDTSFARCLRIDSAGVTTLTVRSNFDSTLTVYGDDGTVYTDDDTNGLDAEISEFLQPGVHFVEVEGYEGSAGTFTIDVVSSAASEDTTDTDAASRTALTFGGLLPMTGNLASLGPPETAGVELAVQEINAAGGVNGTAVVYIQDDSGDNGDVANATVDRLLADDVDAFIGPASSAVSLTVIDKITDAGKIQFSPANTSLIFTDYDDNGLYFRTSPSDAVQGAALADIMIADGAASATFLVRNDGYGTDLLDFARDRFEEQGGLVDLAESYDPKAEAFDDIVAKAAAAGSDAIVIIGFDESSQILAGLIENGIGPSEKLVYGTDGNMNNAFAQDLGDPSLAAGIRGTFPGVNVAGELAEFRDRLLEIDDGLVDYSYSAESFDAVVVTALAAIIAGTNDDPIAIAAEINGVTKEGEKCTTFEECKGLAEDGADIDYDGLSGPLEFFDAGEPSIASILVLEFDQTGVPRIVGTVLTDIG